VQEAAGRRAGEGVLEAGPDQHRGQRQHAREALAEAQEVGRDPGPARGEQPTGATEADRDLVGDHVDPPRLAAATIRR
jgi:hypothetical protein